MMRSSHGSAGSHLLRSAFEAVCAAALALAIAAAPTYAQRGGGGGHSAGGGHFTAGHPGGAHFAAGLRTSRAVTRVHSHYLTYVPGATIHHPMARSSSQNFFASNPPFIGPFSPFQRRFGFSRRGFFPWAGGFWPWWGGGWDGGWWPGCDSYESNCDNGQGLAAGYPESREDSDYETSSEDAARPMIIAYLRDGSGYGALDYWQNNGTFYIETTYGTQKSFSMDQVDVQRTFTENAARGVTFTLLPYPAASDPGPMFAPDSYAPDCPSPSQASQSVAGASTAPSPAATDKAAWFGASGSSSDRGLAVDSVRSDSPAALIGVRAGDIVVRVNCQQIRSAQDIESAVNNTVGPIWVSYMIRGAWLTDKKIAR
jgi:PDZ domain